MPKLSSYTLLGVGDIAPAVDSVLMLDASAPAATATRRALVSSIFRSSLQGTVVPMGPFTLGNGTTDLTFHGGQVSIHGGGILNLKGAELRMETSAVQSLTARPYAPLRVIDETNGDSEFGATYEEFVLNSAVTSAATTYTLSADDAGKTIRFTASNAVTVNVPASLGAGFWCRLVQFGTGVVTPVGTGGATVHGPQNHVATSRQYSAVRIDRVAANQFVASESGWPLVGTIPTLGEVTFTGGGTRSIGFQAFSVVYFQGALAQLYVGGTVNIVGPLQLRTLVVQNDLAAVQMPLVCLDPSDDAGDADFGHTSDLWVVGSVETITAGRTLSNADHGKTLYYAGTSNITLTIPFGLLAGFRVRVVQGSSGKVTAAGSGVTVNGKQGQLSTGGQWHVVQYQRLTASLYIVEGDTAN